MNKLFSWFKPIKRRAAIGWPSRLGTKNTKPKKSTNPKNTTYTNHRRVKHYRIRLTRRWFILISARRFRTSKQRRSKKYRQIIIPLGNLRTKELAIRQKVVRHKKRQPKTYVIVIRPRVLGAYILIILGVIGITYFGFQVKNTGGIEPPKTFALSTPSPVTDYTKPVVMPRSQPARISIAKINLDVQINVVGRNVDGTMETPNVLDYVVGWYKYSPTPGELGPSIIVGHVDSYKGISVFWRVRELVAGDVIAITRVDGTVAKFNVNSLQQFDQATFPTQAVYGDTNYAALRLITCGGTFNRQTYHYTANTVVFATLINS